MPAISASDATNILKTATATGAGGWYAMPQRPSGGVATQFSWQAIVAGTFSGLEVDLEGSNDGTTAFLLDKTTLIGGELRLVTFPVAMIRANVKTFTGGTNVSVVVQPGA